jgi:hypothetical protein
LLVLWPSPAGPPAQDRGKRMSLAQRYRIAAIVPCHNEEAAVAKVVTDLKASVPGMTVYVYDNCSTDRTVEQAHRAGAVVRSEPLKGKGNVVRRAFADIDADIYLLIDGDDTYDAAAAPVMIEKLISENLDHVLGVRREVELSDGGSAYRPAHELGNRLLNRIVCAIFGDTLGDMLSGYRVFSRRFVKSFPAVSREFEIETELTVHSLALRIPSASVPVDFRDRAAGSESKLRTYRDGAKILNVIVGLTRHERPIFFHGLVAGVGALLAVFLGIPVLATYLQTGMVPRFPTLFVASFLLLTSCLSMAAGLIIDGMRKARYEQSRLAYLRLPSVTILEPQSHAHPRIPAQRPNEISVAS